MSRQFGSVASVHVAFAIGALALGCSDTAMQSNAIGAGAAPAPGGASAAGTGGVAGIGPTAGVGAGGMPVAGSGTAGMAPDGAGMMGGPAGAGAAGTGTAGIGPTAGTGTAGTGTGGMAGAAGMGGSSGAGGGDPMAGATCLPASSVDQDGPYTPTHIENGGPTGGSWVFYPEELGMDGMRHPVFNWGPGAGTGPAQYVDHLNRLASHGFVVISQRSSGDGSAEIPALDWLLAENEMSGSTFYQKLDPERVGAGGHSLGSLTTMAMADDPRLGLYVLVCGGCMSSRGGCGAADIHGPTVILGGDTDIGTPNYDSDYAEITSPVAFVIKDGTDHIACARNNLAPWVAFMRWHFCGEGQHMADFVDGGAYCTSPWTCKSKNF